jgi:hypothetical protein
LDDRSVAVFVDVEAMRVAGRFAVGEHLERDDRTLEAYGGCRPAGLV